MERIKELFSELETPQIIIAAFCSIAIGVLCYGVFGSEEEKTLPKNTTLELPEDRVKVENYESKLDAYNKGEQERENSLSLDFERGLFGEKKEDSTAIYEEEKDPKIQELQKQIELMEQQNKNVNLSPSQSSGGASSTRIAPQQSKEEAELEYRKMLLEARNQRIMRSQDYSASQGVEQSNEDLVNKNENIEFRASVYRDQFIMPGDRVTLILTQPLTYKGSLFPKNTFLYATANIKKSRVLLDITNINHVEVNLVAKDIRDGRQGLYNKRAGELWREYQADAQSDGVSDLAGDISRSVNVPLAGSAIRAFGSFFRKKKYKENDKILLIGNHELILTTPN